MTSGPPTSLKASRRSPTASFLFRSFIFLFFFGTETAAEARKTQTFGQRSFSITDGGEQRARGDQTDLA